MNSAVIGKFAIYSFCWRGFNHFQERRVPIVGYVSNLLCGRAREDTSGGDIDIDHSLRANNGSFSDSHSREQKRVRTYAGALLDGGPNEFERFLEHVLVVCEDAAWAEEYAVFDR
jgi:hypothetical protein